MSLIIDVSLILIALYTIISYTHKGFIKSFFGVCKCGNAFIKSYKLAKPIGAIVSDKFMLAKVEPIVNNWLNQISLEVYDNIQINDILNNIPENFQSFLSSLGMDINNLLDVYAGQGATPETVGDLARTMSTFISGFISNAIAYICLFFIAIIVLSIVGFILDKIFSTLPLKPINKFLGFLFGIICAVINIIIVCSIIAVVLSLVEIKYPEYSVEALNSSTVLFRFINSSDIITNIIDFLKKLP